MSETDVLRMEREAKQMEMEEDYKHTSLEYKANSLLDDIDWLREYYIETSYDIDFNKLSWLIAGNKAEEIGKMLLDVWSKEAIKQAEED